MDKSYEPVEMEIIILSQDDIITSSGCPTEGEWD